MSVPSRHEADATQAEALAYSILDSALTECLSRVSDATGILPRQSEHLGGMALTLRLMLQGVRDEVTAGAGLYQSVAKAKWHEREGEWMDRVRRFFEDAGREPDYSLTSRELRTALTQTEEKHRQQEAFLLIAEYDAESDRW